MTASSFPDWGSVPAWISTGSFFIAAVAYYRSVLDKQREQASKVSAWVGIISENDKRKRVLRIINTSDVAVYDLFVKPEGSDPVFVPELPAKESKTLGIGGPPPPVEERSAQAKVSFLGIAVEAKVVSSQVSVESLPVLEFCDAAGRWWRRSSHRRIRRIRHRTVQTVTKTVTNYGLFAVEVDDKLIPPTFRMPRAKSSPPEQPDSEDSP
jgi:hypothetical protein